MLQVQHSASSEAEDGQLCRQQLESEEEKLNLAG